MIVKLLVAYGRFVFGLKPAFLPVTSPLNEGEAFMIVIGVLVDLIVVVGIVGGLLTTLLNKRN